MKKTKLPETPYGHLPPVMRLLYIRAPSCSGTWLADRLAEDAAVEVQLDVQTATAAMARLREESFDTILISHVPGQLDAIHLLQAIRVGSRDDQPILILGEGSPNEMTALCFEAGADAYLCMGQTNVRTLLWQIARAGERQRLRVENRRWRQTHTQQQARQHQEALQQLREQRGLLVDAMNDETPHDDPLPPTWLVEYFRQLLRIYVVTGCGHLREEVSQLVGRLAKCEVTLREALVAHTAAVEELVLGLGNRSAWHVIGRGNLLAYELVLQMTGLELVTD